MSIRPFDQLLSTVLPTLVLILFTYSSSQAQFIMSTESGAFGIYGGVISSDLGLISSLKTKGLPAKQYQGFEVGIKNEFYRTDWAKGNIYVGYAQIGAHEYLDIETGSTPADVEIQALKFAIDPLIFKVGGDFVHGYIGGGMYGSYLFDQEIIGTNVTDQYWSPGPELEKLDYGIDLLAGVHVWNLQLELHAQYGKRDLAERLDGSIAKSKMYSLTLAYMFINRNITRKNCKDTRLL